MGLKDFVILQKLGQGSFATVYKVKRLSDHKTYAMKQIKLNKLDEKASQNALNQIRFLASFHCSNIITYHEAFFEKDKYLLCIIMEYAEGGDLFKNIQQKLSKNLSTVSSRYKPNAKDRQVEKRFPEIQIWKVLISLLHGIGYLHERSILHRDIKPENIFLTSQNNYKLGDLNVSRLLKIQDLGNLTQTGTPYYASPQVWNNQKYDEKSDIWSIGCVIYHMATLKPPFQGNNIEKLYEQVNNCKIKPIPKVYSNQLSQIISMCLRKQSINRPSIKQLLNNWTIQMYNNLLKCNQEEETKLKTEKSTNLLKTISMPKNKNLLQQNLPKPNYDKCRQKQKLKILEPIQVENLKQNFPMVSTPVKKLLLSSAEIQNKNKENQANGLASNCQSQSNLKRSIQRSEKRRSSPRTELSAKKHSIPDQKQIAEKFSRANQNLNYKQIILSKIPYSNMNKKDRIVEQFLGSNSSQAVKSLVKSGNHKLISRKMIFEKVKSLAAL